MSYSDLVETLRKHAEFFAAGHGPLHASAANAIEHLEAALARRPDREGWQPIETAPKDGSLILVSDGEHYALMRWECLGRHKPDWQFEIAGDVAWHQGYDGVEAPDMKPVIWMRLPLISDAR